MNTLFIIGNGFDINLGMDTSYQDFYKYYLKVESESEPIQKLKSSIEYLDSEDWADLELALGKYTENIKTLKEFDEVRDDIGDHLAYYLQEEEKKIDFSKVSKSSFLGDLGNPEKYLPQLDSDKIEGLRAGIGFSSQWGIDIMTLNYTKTIENILGGSFGNVPISQSPIRGVTLRNIWHIHGYTDRRMAIGVNDVSQMANESFRDNQDILEAIVKPDYNRAQKHAIDNQCKQLISEANLICIYGSSLGDTDKMWWELIGQRLSGNCRLIIFYHHKQQSSLRLDNRRGRIERQVFNNFADKAGLLESERDAIRDNVCIGINTGLFQGISRVNRQS